MTDFAWPCDRRDAHGPHEIHPAFDEPEKCPGVPAHPDTMIGGRGRSAIQPAGYLVGPGPNVALACDPETGESRWIPQVGDEIVVVPLGPRIRPARVPGSVYANLPVPPLDAQTPWGMGAGRQELIGEVLGEECSGTCIMASELIESAPNTVAYVDPSCPLHGSWSENRQTGHSHVLSEPCRPDRCAGHPRWAEIRSQS